MSSVVAEHCYMLYVLFAHERQSTDVTGVWRGEVLGEEDYGEGWCEKINIFEA
jgi:hypothetical protein